LRTRLLGLLALPLAACWAGDRAPLPDGPATWAPVAGTAPGGRWQVVELSTSLACPDGQTARLWLARPESPAGPMPLAVLFHGGAFDYPLSDPGSDTDTDTPASPSGTWRSPTRLTRDWSDRRSWASLGQWSSDDPDVVHTGALPLALAEREHAILAVPNCWGDYGVNEGDNDVAADGFERQGGALTRLAWRIATEEGFAATQDLDPGLVPITDQAVAVGLGEGGRSVGVLVKDSALEPPAAVILDSVDDDLRVYFDDPGVWSEQVEGLERIWPDGRSGAQQTRLGNAPLPATTHLVLSAADPSLPAGIIDELATHVTARGGTVTDTGQTRHIQLAGDLELARTVVADVLGEAPDTDDTDI